MQSDVNFPLVLCKPTSQIIQPKFNQCKRFVLHPHFSFIYLTISILGSSIIFGLSLKYTLRFVPSNLWRYKNKKSDSHDENRIFISLSYFWEKWVVMDSNHRRHSQQIYSLPHLATLVTTQKLLICELSLFDKSFVLKSECKGSAFFSFHQIFLHLFSLFPQKTSFFP